MYNEPLSDVVSWIPLKKIPSDRKGEKKRKKITSNYLKKNGSASTSENWALYIGGGKATLSSFVIQLNNWGVDVVNVGYENINSQKFTAVKECT